MTRQLQSERSTFIGLGVSVTRIFAFFVALSLLFGPLAMDRAMAAAPASRHSQMKHDGHCQPADNGKTDKAKSPCCAAMCATSAVVPQASPSERIFARLPAIAAPAHFRRGVLSELATPPPRRA